MNVNIRIAPHISASISVDSRAAGPGPAVPPSPGTGPGYPGLSGPGMQFDTRLGLTQLRTRKCRPAPQRRRGRRLTLLEISAVILYLDGTNIYGKYNLIYFVRGFRCSR